MENDSRKEEDRKSMVIHPFKAVVPTAAYLTQFPTASTQENPDLLQQLPEGVNYASLMRGLKEASETKGESVRAKLEHLIEEGVVLQQMTRPGVILYEIGHEDKRYDAMVTLLDAQDYLEGRIKKHEQTRPEKVEKMSNVFGLNGFNGNPILVSYADNAGIGAWVDAYKAANKPNHELESGRGKDKLWLVDDEKAVEEILNLFKQVDGLYIADGHHRCETLSQVGDGKILATLINYDQLSVKTFYRCIADLGKKEYKEAWKKLLEAMSWELCVAEPELEDGMVKMWAEGKWYKGMMPTLDVHEVSHSNGLDVSKLDRWLLAEVMGLGDTRLSPNVKFVSEWEMSLKRAGKSEEYLKKFQLVFGTKSLDFKDVVIVSDEGGTMPPKSTWIEPKMRGGLFIHKFDS